jgi:hypothetical protein
MLVFEAELAHLPARSSPQFRNRSDMVEKTKVRDFPGTFAPYRFSGRQDW